MKPRRRNVALSPLSCLWQLRSGYALMMSAFDPQDSLSDVYAALGIDPARYGNMEETFAFGVVEFAGLDDIPLRDLYLDETLMEEFLVAAGAIFYPMSRSSNSSTAAFAREMTHYLDCVLAGAPVDMRTNLDTYFDPSLDEAGVEALVKMYGQGPL